MTDKEVIRKLRMIIADAAQMHIHAAELHCLLIDLLADLKEPEKGDNT